MLKIFLTGDAHIGLKYARRRQGAMLEKARVDAFKNMVATSNDEGCGLFVIAGDLFDNNFQCTKEEVRELLTILTGFHGVVAILPGNHDFYTMESKLWQYMTEISATMGNIVLLTDAREYPLSVAGERVILYPAPCTTLHSSENVLGWMKDLNITPDADYRVGIAHGTLRGLAPDTDELYFPMNSDELNAIPMDVWLLGHVHVPYPRNLSLDARVIHEPIFNAGTHVQTHHKCNTEGCSFIISIDEGKQVMAKKVITGNVRFFALDVHLEAGKMKEGIQKELRDIPRNSVVDMYLSGAVSSEEYDGRADIIQPLLARFIEADYADFSLSRLISQGLIDQAFPQTSFSAQLLKALMAEPKEAQMAFELLTTLKEGAKK